MSRDRFLAASVDLFEDTGEPPPLKLVQRELEVWHDETSARREARRLPSNLGDVKDDRVYLKIRAVQETNPGSPLLEIFHAGLKVAIRQYRKRDRKEAVIITSAELMKHAGLSQHEAVRALHMLSAEHLVEKVGGGEWEVVPAARHYRFARNADDYLSRKKKFERSQCRRRTFSRPGKLVKSLLGQGGIVRLAIVGALTTVLATFLIWLAVTLWEMKSEDSPQGLQQGQTKSERSSP